MCVLTLSAILAWVWGLTFINICTSYKEKAHKIKIIFNVRAVQKKRAMEGMSARSCINFVMFTDRVHSWFLGIPEHRSMYSHHQMCCMWPHSGRVSIHRKHQLQKEMIHFSLFFFLKQCIFIKIYLNNVESKQKSYYCRLWKSLEKLPKPTFFTTFICSAVKATL